MNEDAMSLGHTEVVNVYFDDLDAYGMVYSNKVQVLAERAIYATVAELGYPFGHPDATALVGEFSTRISAPIVGIGPVDVWMCVEHLGSSSLTCGFRISRGSIELATGTRTLIKIDPQTQRPTPWSDAFRGTLEGEKLIRH